MTLAPLLTPCSRDVSLCVLCSLSRLDLSHNYLRTVTSDLVSGLPNVESLDLTDNDVAAVEPGVLARLPRLVHLLLTGEFIASALSLSLSRPVRQ